MVERYELRLYSRYKHMLGDLIPDHSEPSGAVTILRGTVGDRLFIHINELDLLSRKSDLGSIFAGWDIKRSYSKDEIEQAKLFFLKIPFTHVAGEEYGTKYQEASDCLQEAYNIEIIDRGKSRIVPQKVPCGICSRQASILCIPFRKLSLKRDIYRVWGGELILSQRLATLINEGGFTGGALFPVQDVRSEPATPLDLSVCRAGVELLSNAAARGMHPREMDFWWWLYQDAPKPLLNELLAHQKTLRLRPKESEVALSKRSLAQLTLLSRPLDLSAQTRFGDHPFDRKAGGSFSCKSGEIAGSSPISSLSVAGSSWDGSDLCQTRAYVGRRQGLFRPHQLLIVSKKFFTAIQREGMKGFGFELVDLV